MFVWYFFLVDVMIGFYLCEVSINVINSDVFCVYFGDNVCVKVFKLLVEFCYLWRRYV